VNIVCDTTNKVFRRGHEKTIEYTSLVCLDEVKAGGIRGSEDLVQDRMNYFAVSVLLFAAVSVLLEDSGIWDANPTQNPKEKGDDKLYSPRDGSELNAEILNSQFIAASRADRYCTLFHITKPKQVH